ncbi:DUF2909 domain-containing protein [Vibrio hannami]|uniref:DUF2909 domain-containing protein n=1 Tax=Vibrio hannami TaxID=2717094 RepID=UPI00240EED1D|nr:DUF2909 domain-containing protein [Vibrio hannami]MDG3088482.1 DUF2909 domain-containing protein [Vibrio hannami]
MSLVLKVVLVLLLLFIIFNLVKALIQMVRESESDNQPPMSHYLGRRLMLSALVVILLIIALTSGWIAPNPRPY